MCHDVLDNLCFWTLFQMLKITFRRFWAEASLKLQVFNLKI